MRKLFHNLLAVAGLALASTTVMAAEVKAQEPLPDLSKVAFGGKLPDLKGKVVVIDFWASWCGPCKKSFPVLKDLHEKFSARGLVIVAISLDEEVSAAEGFLKENPVPFTTLTDPKGASAEIIGVEKMPTTLVIGADGKIRAVHEKFNAETTPKEYAQEIEAAIVAAGK